MLLIKFAPDGNVYVAVTEMPSGNTTLLRFLSWQNGSENELIHRALTFLAVAVALSGKDGEKSQ